MIDRADISGLLDDDPPDDPRQSYVDDYLDFDGLFEAEPVHHRWLLTTCVAGIAGSLVVGSALLGIFGQNAVPRDAYAGIQKSEITGTTSFAGDADVNVLGEGSPIYSAAYQPQESGSLVVPSRESYPEINSEDLMYGDGKTVVLDAEIASAEAGQGANITTIAPPEPIDERIKLAKGQTIADMLVDRGVTRDAAEALVAAIEPVYPVAQIREGTRIDITLDRQQNFYGKDVTFPVEVSFRPGPDETIRVEADEDGRFVAAIVGAEAGATSQYAIIDHFRTRAQVGTSLYATAKDHKVPSYIVAELTRVFGYDVDFQRQVKANDTFDIFYGNPLSGTSSKRKVMHFAQLTLGGKTKTFYRFTTADGMTDYYDDNGLSATKALLKTPVSGAKLTSSYGMRKHPLLGYNKMHTGVDFGAPHGTPIRASGSGVIKLAGRHGAYGITVEIQHAGKYQTLYAHMSRLAAGISKGAKVNQGQVIGYVGTTGRSTGPHLHYEVRVNDRPVNPTRVKAAGSKQLAGKELQRFRQMKQRVLAMMQSAPSADKVAQINP